MEVLSNNSNSFQYGGIQTLFGIYYSYGEPNLLVSCSDYFGKLSIVKKNGKRRKDCLLLKKSLTLTILTAYITCRDIPTLGLLIYDTIYDTIGTRMSKKEKAIQRLRDNPKNVRFDEICTILNRLGFSKRQEGTSHAVFTLGKHRITIPFHQPFVKPIYIKLMLEMIDSIQELEDSGEE